MAAQAQSQLVSAQRETDSEYSYVNRTSSPCAHLPKAQGMHRGQDKQAAGNRSRGGLT